MTDDTTSLSPRALSLRQGRFVLEYLKDGNATQAYLRAGYAPRGAQPSASRLLRDPRIEAAVTAGRQRVADALEPTVQRIAQEYARMAFANMSDFVSTDANGRLRIDLDKASQAQQAGILELKVTDHRKGEQTVTLKLGKLQALAALTRHVGLLVKKPAPGLTAQARQNYEERCDMYRRTLDHRERENEQLRQALREPREPVPATVEPHVPEPHVPEKPPKSAVMPGMPPEPPPDCTPGHLNGKIFWNTDRSPPPGPTWNEIIRKAGPGGFPGW